MTGMEHIVAVRRKRAKPAAVTVRLVPEPCRHPFGLSWLDFSGTGHFTVEVPPTDRLGDLDLRPLKGLFVTVEDITDNPPRHRRLAAMVALAGPETLVMPSYVDDRLTLHIRRGAETETHVLP